MDARYDEPTEAGEDSHQHGWGGRCARLDAITRHRLESLGLEAERLAGLRMRVRMDVLYRRFLERVPYENLSNHRICRAHPQDPDAWPRATDKFLRDNRSRGLGGTSFTLAYALRDLLQGIGANAHLTLGRNLVTEDTLAAVVAFAPEGALLYDPALLASGPIPLEPGGSLQDPIGEARCEACGGGNLTVKLSQPGFDHPRPVYSVVPLPAPPHRFRQAWVASFYRGRRGPLLIARRTGDEIHRYSAGSGRLEILAPWGLEQHDLGPRPIADLHRIFGIEESCLRAWFDDDRDEEGGA